RNLQAVEELKTLAARYRKTLPQFALRWTLSDPVVSTALVGFRQPTEVEENLGALGWTISTADMAAVDAIFARHGAMTMPPGWLEDEESLARSKSMPVQTVAPMIKDFATFDCD